MDRQLREHSPLFSSACVLYDSPLLHFLLLFHLVSLLYVYDIPLYIWRARGWMDRHLVLMTIKADKSQDL